MSEEDRVLDEKKCLPSDGATREFLIDLMHRLPGEMAEKAHDLREDAVRAQRDVRFAAASLESVANYLDDLQASLRSLCRGVQTLLMIGPVWDITQPDDHDVEEKCIKD